MKTFALAALLGLISAKDTTGVWQLKSVLSHRDEQVLQNYFGDVATARANARPPMRSHIELDSDSGSSDDESDDETNVQFVPGDSGRASGYTRVVPERFSSDSDDLFIRSMISSYATEVLATHKGLTGAAADAYLATYFAKAWGHFDVNKTGEIAVVRTPEFMRFLCSDQYMSLG